MIESLQKQIDAKATQEAAKEWREFCALVGGFFCKPIGKSGCYISDAGGALNVYGPDVKLTGELQAALLSLGMNWRKARAESLASDKAAAIVSDNARLAAVIFGEDSPEARQMRGEGPRKHQSTTQPGLYFWAEEIITGGKPRAWNVVSQVDGFPSTEAHDDWFADEKTADEIAQKLALGVDLNAPAAEPEPKSMDEPIRQDSERHEAEETRERNR